MNFNKSSFLKAVNALDPEAKRLEGEAKKTFLAWMLISGVPNELANLLADTIPKDGVRFSSGGYIYEDHSIMDCNEEYKKMMESGFLQVGHAPNGDQIAIDFKKEGRSGYISHDEFYESYEDEEDTIVDDMFIPVADSIGDMCLSLVEDRDFPIDIYDAEDKGYANQTSLTTPGAPPPSS